MPAGARAGRNCERPMPANPKIVVRFDFPYHPAMAERFAREDDIDLRTCERSGAENLGWSALNEAHVYMISSAKDELPRRWFVTAELLQRCPRLLCVSTSGAGYDTVDVEACSKAGVIVVNQTGINAPAVAEHTLGMMLALSKRIAECDRRLRRERGFAREDLMGREISGKTLGIVGIGHVGTRVDVRIIRQHGHAEGLRQACDARTDMADADNAEHFSGNFPSHQVFAREAALAPQPPVAFGDPLGQREHHAECVLGDRRRIDAGLID